MNNKIEIGKIIQIPNKSTSNDAIIGITIPEMLTGMKKAL